jgi:glycosyltransferase involved in cell wall biosynthesis
MATGLPVIATEVSGSKQVVFSGATGLLIPPGDSQKLADAIEEIITQPQWASEMGQAARRRIEEKYNASKQVREYIDLYRKRYLTSNSW